MGDGWASVMLISDTRSLVTGLDTRTRATGEVTGRLAAPLAMSNIPVTDKIAVNDRVVTAGIDLGKRFRSFFPKNIPIGRVVDVEQEPGSIVQTALVQPAADLEHIEDVLVLTDVRLPQRPGVPEPTNPRGGRRGRGRGPVSAHPAGRRGDEAAHAAARAPGLRAGTFRGAQDPDHLGMAGAPARRPPLDRTCSTRTAQAACPARGAPATHAPGELVRIVVLLLSLVALFASTLGTRAGQQRHGRRSRRPRRSRPSSWPGRSTA